MVRLTELKNERATNLFKELVQEIENYTVEHGILLSRPIAPIVENIGTYKSTRSLGRCTAKRLGNEVVKFTIALNKELVLNGTDTEIKNVLTHELIHTNEYCFDHRKMFKHKVDLIKLHLGYDGLNKTFERKCVTGKKQRDIVYKCTQCGKLFYRYRHINTNKYYCSCHGRLELVPYM